MRVSCIIFLRTVWTQIDDMELQEKSTCLEFQFVLYINIFIIVTEESKNAPKTRKHGGPQINPRDCHSHSGNSVLKCGGLAKSLLCIVWRWWWASNNQNWRVILLMCEVGGPFSMLLHPSDLEVKVESDISVERFYHDSVYRRTWSKHRPLIYLIAYSSWH